MRAAVASPKTLLGNVLAGAVIALTSMVAVLSLGIVALGGQGPTALLMGMAVAIEILGRPLFQRNRHIAVVTHSACSGANARHPGYKTPGIRHNKSSSVLRQRKRGELPLGR